MCKCPACLQVVIDVLQAALQTGPEVNSTLGSVQHLARLFPQFSDFVLQQVLTAVGGDISAAADELVAADADEKALPGPVMVITNFRMYYIYWIIMLTRPLGGLPHLESCSAFSAGIRAQVSMSQ